jgi:hypothetical protein
MNSSFNDDYCSVDTHFVLRECAANQSAQQGSIQCDEVNEASKKSISLLATSECTVEYKSKQGFNDCSLSVPNIAYLYGEATQGATYGSSVASYAIDDDFSTYNHTKCNATDNWWEVKLPEPTYISDIIIYNRSGQTARLSGTKMYLGSNEYNSTLVEENHIETLTGSRTAQEFSYEPLKKATYLLLKAEGSNCLHTPEVRVYGTLPPEPRFLEHDSEYLIKGSSQVGDEVVALEVVDYNNRPLTFSIDNPLFKIDTQGKITVNGTLDSPTYNVIVTVSNGKESSVTHLIINVGSVNIKGRKTKKVI